MLVFAVAGSTVGCCCLAIGSAADSQPEPAAGLAVLAVLSQSAQLVLVRIAGMVAMCCAVLCCCCAVQSPRIPYQMPTLLQSVAVSGSGSTLTITCCSSSSTNYHGTLLPSASDGGWVHAAGCESCAAGDSRDPAPSHSRSCSRQVSHARRNQLPHECPARTPPPCPPTPLSSAPLSPCSPSFPSSSSHCCGPAPPPTSCRTRPTRTTTSANGPRWSSKALSGSRST